MSKRTALFAAGAVGLVAILALGWYLVSPLFIDKTVDEAFPFAEAVGRVETEPMLEGSEDDLASEPDQADEIMVEEEMMDEEEATVEEPMEEATAEPANDEWLLVAEGHFRGTDSVHQGAGTAAVYQLGEQRVLRFEEFSVTNGPDLHVILTKHPAPVGRTDVGDDYLDLGSLKGNLGNQNYEIPTEADLSQYQGVVIYCVPFHVVFATATLG